MNIHPDILAAAATESSTPATAPAPKAKRAPRAAKAKGKTAKTKKADVDTTSTASKNPRSIVPTRYKERYAAFGGTNGDKLTLALKSATTMKNDDGRDTLDLPALKAIAEANGVWKPIYEGLNNGQKRMNVANRLRGMLKNGAKVVIGKQVFANAAKALAKTEADEPKAKRAPRAAKTEAHAAA